METSMGELISEVVLIDGYSLYLRYYRIREHINSKLRELNSRQGYAQVEIDVCDRLTITFFVNGNKIDEKILVKEGLNKSSDISQKNKRTFIEDINKMFDNINSNQTNKMKKIKKGVAPLATKEESSFIAQDVVKIISLCQGENGSFMEKAGFNVSEACRKLTNGIVDSAIVDEVGAFTFINNKGFSMNFNPVGHSEEEVVSAITTIINTMMVLDETLNPLNENTQVTVIHNNKPEEDLSVEHEQFTAMSKEVSTTPKGKQSRFQTKEYNKRLAETLETIDIDPDISKRGFSQQFRGKILKCAHAAGLAVSKGTSIEILVNQINAENIQRAQAIYDLYKQETPAWFVKLSEKGVVKKRTIGA